MAQVQAKKARRGLPAEPGRPHRRPPSRSARLLRRLLFVAMLFVALIAVANLPTTTLRGVNYVVGPESLPLYAKTLDFLDRDVNYRRLARRVTAGAYTDEARLRAAFDWTRANIRDTPPGFPVIDDHIWYVIVRGYGQEDQKADAFTTLLTYSGVAAYWIFIGPRPELPLALAKIDGRWRPVDVANGVVFQAKSGGLADIEELASNHALAASQGPSTYRGLPYERYFERFHAPVPPDLMRAEMQMPGPRLWFVMKHILGRGGRQWEMRPASRVATNGS